MPRGVPWGALEGRKFVEAEAADRLAEALRKCCDQRLGWYDEARSALEKYEADNDRR